MLFSLSDTCVLLCSTSLSHRQTQSKPSYIFSLYTHAPHIHSSGPLSTLCLYLSLSHEKQFLPLSRNFMSNISMPLYLTYTCTYYLSHLIQQYHTLFHKLLHLSLFEHMLLSYILLHTTLLPPPPTRLPHPNVSLVGR